MSNHHLLPPQSLCIPTIMFIKNAVSLDDAVGIMNLPFVKAQSRENHFFPKVEYRGIVHLDGKA